MTKINDNKVAVVTGALTGLGLATAGELAKQGHRVIICGRHPQQGEAKAKEMKANGWDVSFKILDVSNCAMVQDFCSHVLAQHGHVDILVNNAGIFEDKDAEDMCAEAAVIMKTFQTNTVGPYLLCRGLVPAMLERNYGRVVNVSSGMGQLTHMNSGYPGYRLSKAAVNAVTRIFAEEAKGRNVLINSVCPGWVKTRMGGEGATRSLEAGIKGIVWAAALPDNGPSGGFFRDGKRMEW